MHNLKLHKHLKLGDIWRNTTLLLYCFFFYSKLLSVIFFNNNYWLSFLLNEKGAAKHANLALWPHTRIDIASKRHGEFIFTSRQYCRIILIHDSVTPLYLLGGVKTSIYPLNWDL